MAYKCVHRRLPCDVTNLNSRRTSKYITTFTCIEQSRMPRTLNLNLFHFGYVIATDRRPNRILEYFDFD